MSSSPQRALVFEAAVGVRHIEVGLASLMSIIFGLTMFVYGVALATAITRDGLAGWRWSAD